MAKITSGTFYGTFYHPDDDYRVSDHLARMPLDPEPPEEEADAAIASWIRAGHQQGYTAALEDISILLAEEIVRRDTPSPVCDHCAVMLPGLRLASRIIRDAR